ncbi:glycosyltransferase family 4 protein [Flavobacterium aciduliphilum]|uniref:Glycosyltransferase involved in cell wall biosynthesis n=1 Tax=Flavobacterium aciduliphilum TaxID=1101402 RepID=A0A328YBV2_9FLAO|nr:glycosyltransferase family 4 protein [Flavobacterium aciduliphilum]RAR69295.1 glycosyltransferase involved in cell wall biosynthesis [Flavobacterium aciduliphilum]
MNSNNCKVILISTFPLPYSKIGSWTTLYKNYIEQEHQIDYIVCEQPEALFPNCEYTIVENSLATKIASKILKNIRLKYLKALDKVLPREGKYIIQIVDNFGIIKPLIHFLNSKGIRKNGYIQFFYHGHTPFYTDFASRFFYESIDEMVLLTKDSYQLHKNFYNQLPCRFSILHNGIDTSKFYALDKNLKNHLRIQKGISDKIIFVWCAQDRPKKGLHIILEAWKRVFKKRAAIELWVIGTEKKASQEGITFFGKIPNNELPEFLQVSDCYLFPTLCQEGFGMSLIEALHCGNYCIASAMGGVPEVLQYGAFGQLIEEPHVVSSWENAILEYIDHPIKQNNFDTNLYTSKSWNEGMNEIITNAKLCLNSSD